MCTQQSWKVIWDVGQYTVPDILSCRTYFCYFPLLLANRRPRPLVPFFHISSKKSELKTTHNPFRDCCLKGLLPVLFPTTYLEIAVCILSKIQLMVYYQFWVLIGGATTRLYISSLVAKSAGFENQNNRGWIAFCWLNMFCRDIFDQLVRFY